LPKIEENHEEYAKHFTVNASVKVSRLLKETAGPKERVAEYG